MNNKTFIPPTIGKLYKVIRVSMAWSLSSENTWKSCDINKDRIITFFSIEKVKCNSLPDGAFYYLCNFINNNSKYYQFRINEYDDINHYIKEL